MIQIGYRTHKGMVRSHNEDACFIIPESDIYVVADGVGGNKGGEIASRTCVYEITQYVNTNALPQDAEARTIRNYLKECLKYVNQKILEKVSEQGEEGMATTVVICCIRDKYAYIGHLGDSRAYILRAGRMTQITRDHTYVNALINAGVITEEEALTHEKRHVITKALGAEEEIKPDFKQVELESGDILLLCTDGLHGELDEERIADILVQKSDSMAEAADLLIREANEAGGTDNITAICLRV